MRARRSRSRSTWPQYSVKFEVSGNDLADVFYLTGLALPNTPPYRLSADVEHRGTLFRMDNLKGKLGSSDIEGIGGDRDRPQAAEVHREAALRYPQHRRSCADPGTSRGAGEYPLGADSAARRQARAARRRGAAAQAAPAEAQPAASQCLFPDADLQVNRVRGMDADVTYQARSVVAPKMPMKEVRFHLLLNDGVLKIDPLSFVLDSGKFAGNVTIDAAKDVPESTIDMGIDDVDLSQFTSAKLKQPPLAGLHRRDG